MTAALLALWLASPAVTSFVYRVCFTADPTKADVVAHVADKQSARFCVWDTMDCETAEMVVYRAPGGPFSVYLSSSPSRCW